jgi:serine phosphatase RsbU (regulator of sigma subunit)
LATDGLFEMRAPDGEFFGADRCLRLIHDRRGHTVQQIVDDLLEATGTFARGTLPVHDLTIVIAKGK